MKYKLTNEQILYVISKVGEDVIIDIPDTLRTVEPWKPRTKAQLKTQGDWGDVIQARTDDIARVLEEIAGKEMASCKHVMRAAERIRELE